jgi:hypothetical protein
MKIMGHKTISSQVSTYPVCNDYLPVAVRLQSVPELPSTPEN